MQNKVKKIFKYLIFKVIFLTLLSGKCGSEGNNQQPERPEEEPKNSKKKFGEIQIGILKGTKKGRKKNQSNFTFGKVKDNVITIVSDLGDGNSIGLLYIPININLKKEKEPKPELEYIETSSQKNAFEISSHSYKRDKDPKTKVYEIHLLPKSLMKPASKNHPLKQEILHFKFTHPEYESKPFSIIIQYS